MRRSPWHIAEQDIAEQQRNLRSKKKTAREELRVPKTSERSECDALVRHRREKQDNARQSSGGIKRQVRIVPLLQMEKQRKVSARRQSADKDGTSKFMARQDSNTHEFVAYDAVQEDGESVGTRTTPVYENITHSFPAGKTRGLTLDV